MFMKRICLERRYHSRDFIWNEKERTTKDSVHGGPAWLNDITVWTEIDLGE